HVGEKDCGFVCRETQLLGPQLGNLPSRAQPCERQRRIFAGGDYQVQIWQVIEQEAHRLVDRRCLEFVIIVEHQHAALRQYGQVVEQGGQQGFQRRRRVQQREQCRAPLGRQRLQRSYQVAQKHRRVVIPRIQ